MNIVLSASRLYLQNKNLLNVTWNITMKCNFHCEYCDITNMVDRPTNDVSLDDGYKVIDKLFSIKDKDIRFIISGGEPTLYPHLLKILSYINKKQNENPIIKELLIFTNLSSTTSYYKKCYENYPDLIIMPSYHREFIDYKEFYTRYIELQELGYSSLKSPFMVHTPECKTIFLKMIKEFPNVDYYIKSLLGDPTYIDDLNEYQRKNFDHDDMFAIVYEDGKIQSKQVTKISEKNFKFYYCTASSQNLFIFNDGRINSCLHRSTLKTENMLTTDLNKYLNKPNFICINKRCHCHWLIPKVHREYKFLLDMSYDEILTWIDKS